MHSVTPISFFRKETEQRQSRGFVGESIPSDQSPKRTIEMKDLENKYFHILLPAEASFVLPNNVSG